MELHDMFALGKWFPHCKSPGARSCGSASELQSGKVSRPGLITDEGELQHFRIVMLHDMSAMLLVEALSSHAAECAVPAHHPRTRRTLIELLLRCCHYVILRSLAICPISTSLIRAAVDACGVEHAYIQTSLIRVTAAVQGTLSKRTKPAAAFRFLTCSQAFYWDLSPIDASAGSKSPR